MTRILYHQPTATLVPYPRDDDGPVVGLDPTYLDLQLIQLPPPTTQPGEELRPTEVIDLQALTVTRGWEVLPPPVPPTPQPDWASFKEVLLSSQGLKNFLLSSLSTEPTAVLSLPTTLINLSNGVLPDDFARAWTALSSAVQPSPELIQEIITAAQTANLPEEFIALLSTNQN